MAVTSIWMNPTTETSSDTIRDMAPDLLVSVHVLSVLAPALLSHPPDVCGKGTFRLESPSCM